MVAMLRHGSKNQGKTSQKLSRENAQKGSLDRKLEDRMRARRAECALSNQVLITVYIKVSRCPLGGAADEVHRPAALLGQAKGNVANVASGKDRDSEVIGGWEGFFGTKQLTRSFEVDFFGLGELRAI